jgi:hypothetical protein
MPPNKRYIAYMLRLWRVNSTELSDWQASLEDPHNGKQIGFADLVSLFSYLKDQTGKDRENEETLEDEGV